MSGSWRRVSSREPCPICGKPDWCGVARDGPVAVCMRVSSATPTRNGGWSHRLTDDPRPVRRHVVRVVVRTGSTRHFAQLAARYTQAASDGLVQRLAEQLGTSVKSLQRLQVGWDGEAWTFPMRGAAGRVVGIRRRFPDGRKLSVKGGHEGLFVPDGVQLGDELFVCEGPTDAAAMLSLGLNVVGRPSCRGGVDELVRFVRATRPEGVVIVGDRDRPGRAGAQGLASRLCLYCRAVAVIFPPDGVNDARAWVQLGATAVDVRRAVDDAVPVRLSINENRQPLRGRRLAEENSNV